MKVKSVNIQVNTNQGEQPEFVLVNPSAFDILEALQLTHRAVQVVGEHPTSTTVIIVWDSDEHIRAVLHGASADAASGNGGTEVPQNEWDEKNARPPLRPQGSQLVPPLRPEEVPLFLRDKVRDE